MQNSEPHALSLRKLGVINELQRLPLPLHGRQHITLPLPPQQLPPHMHRSTAGTPIPMQPRTARRSTPLVPHSRHPHTLPALRDPRMPRLIHPPPHLLLQLWPHPRLLPRRAHLLLRALHPWRAWLRPSHTTEPIQPRLLRQGRSPLSQFSCPLLTSPR